MGRVFDEIDGELRSFIEGQRLFFVATAPSFGGHVNLSPKGLDSFRIAGPRTVIYLDYVGSGAETIAHLRDNGRIAIMFCAFEGPPKIVRLQGRGEAVEPQDPDYTALRASFPSRVPARSIIRVSVDRISDSCGFGVPLYQFEGHRDRLEEWSNRKGERGLREYQETKNRTSIDGLPALRWPEPKEDHSEPAAPSPDAVRFPSGRISPMNARRPEPTEFAPFYAGYIARVSETDVLPALAAQPEQLLQLARSVPSELELFRYAPEKWSVRQTFGHLVDTERVLSYRAFCIARGETQALPGFDENEYVARADSDERPVAEIAGEFAAVRQATVLMIRRWKPDEWDRIGNANAKAISARALAFIMAGHVRHHVALLQERYGLKPDA